MNLTPEEALALRDELAHHCVSYYSATLRSALEIVIKECDRIIEENEEIQFDVYSLPNEE